MTTPIPHTSPLFTAIVTASRVTVIPITDHGLITIAHAPAGGWPWCALPTTIKAHPRVRTDTAADRLLARDLRCEHAGLRLVAIFDPQPAHPHREALYTAEVSWPHGRPDRTGTDRHRLLTLTTRAQATELGLRAPRILALLAGHDLPAAARALPELVAAPAPGAPDTALGHTVPAGCAARRLR